MAPQISGYSVYRAMEMPRKTTKSRVFRPKKRYEMYWIHGAL